MGICGWICFGFFSGLVARAIMPGNQNMGIFATIFLGIAGSFLGGWVGAVLGGGSTERIEPSGFIGAVLGAIGILILGELLFRRSKRRR